MTPVETIQARIGRINSLRAALWKNHPLVNATAKLPTPSSLDVVKLLLKCHRRGRESFGLFAAPVTGKSFCIEICIGYLQAEYPGCGCITWEPPSKVENNRELTSKKVAPGFWRPSEGGYYEEMLDACGFEFRPAGSVTGKRRQLIQALVTIAGEGRRLTIFIDEAQELTHIEFAWLKRIINAVIAKKCIVVVVLFGQEELQKTFESVVQEARSDLGIRFARRALAFPGIRSEQELALALGGCDEVLDFPEGSGICYTEFFWPKAFARKFRLSSQASSFWKALHDVVPRDGDHGIAMEWIARSLAEFVEITLKRDADKFEPSEQDWTKAVKQSGYSAKWVDMSKRRGTRKGTSSRTNGAEEGDCDR